MIKQLTLNKPRNSSTAKLFFPEHILLKIRWGTSTSLRIKLMSDGFGIQIHKNMLDEKESIYLKDKYLYTALYLILPKSFNIIRTLPIMCGYIINWETYPTILNVLFPSYLKKNGIIIKMTNSPSKVITLL